MLQKIFIGLLALATLAMITFGLLDAARAPQPAAAALIQPSAAPTTPPAAPSAPNTPDAAAPAQQPAAGDSVGEAWSASGTIKALDDFNLTLATTTGDYLIELGPPTYWQAQGVALPIGAQAQVEGYFNGDQYHARIVTVGTAQLVIRDEAGRPMWAGNGQSGNTASGTPGQTSGQVEVQIPADAWKTLKGTVEAVNNGNVTFTGTDGATATGIIPLQMGQRRFWQDQGVVLAAGDAVEVLGYWQNGQFMVADLLKVATGEHIILRDPNGRQLWGGPGRNGQTNGNGNGQGRNSTTPTPAN